MFYHYYEVATGHGFSETELLFPIVTGSRFSASFLVSLCSRVAAVANRGSWPGNYKNLECKACEILKPKFGSLNSKRR